VKRDDFQGEKGQGGVSVREHIIRYGDHRDRQKTLMPQQDPKVAMKKTLEAAVKMACVNMTSL